MNCEASEWKPFEKLRKLEISDANLNDEFLSGFFTSNLMEAIFSNTKLTDNGLKYLAENCDLLRRVNADKCKEITMKGVSHMIDELNHMIKVSCLSCKQIDSSIYNLILQKRRVNTHVFYDESEEVDEENSEHESEEDHEDESEEEEESDEEGNSQDSKMSLMRILSLKLSSKIKCNIANKNYLSKCINFFRFFKISM